MKIGRNDPCPCGSGKKYKHCCLRNESAPEPVESTALSAQRKASDFLQNRFRARQRDAIFEDFFGQFEDQDELNAATRDLDAGLAQMLVINLNDWLLCETQYERQGDWKLGIEWVVADRQLRLSDDERAYLQALANSPLRLYEVTSIERGRGFCLRDLHEIGAAARFVHEVSGTRNAREGDVLGVRLTEDPDLTLRMGGAVYTFNRIQALTLLEEMRADQCALEGAPTLAAPTEVDDELIAEIIRVNWLGALLTPPPSPMVVTRDGEPILLIEDEYDVLDSTALQSALATQSDVERDAEGGWIRLLHVDDTGSARILSAINPGEGVGTIVLFHRAASLAEQGREWLGRIAGDTIRHRERRTVDPAELLANRKKSDRPPPKPKGLDGITPEQHSAVIAKAVQSSYAEWCDLPLPIFQHASPRELIATRAGRERVRFLLRTYELGERQMAAEQNRPPIIYDFLWEKLNLAREEPTL